MLASLRAAGARALVQRVAASSVRVVPAPRSAPRSAGRNQLVAANQARSLGSIAIPQLYNDAGFHVLDGKLDTRSDGYKENVAAMNKSVADLTAALDAVRAGGGAKAVERHRARGKMLPRERIDALLDAE